MKPNELKKIQEHLDAKTEIISHPEKYFPQKVIAAGIHIGGMKTVLKELGYEVNSDGKIVPAN